MNPVERDSAAGTAAVSKSDLAPRARFDSRPRVLFLSQCLPYPPHSGVTRRTYNIVRELQVAYDVRLVAFYRKQHQRDNSAVNAAVRQLKHELDTVATPAAIPSEHSMPRRLFDHVGSLITRKPYTYYEYYNRSFAGELQRTLKDWLPDLIHVDSLDLYRWIEETPAVPRTCTHHSIESELLRLRANVVSSPLLAWYIRHQANLVEKIERRFTTLVDVNIMMSDVDGERLRKLAPKCRTVTVPNGVDVDYFRPIRNRRIRDKVVFLGPSYMLPNRDAIEFFLDQVWPRIRRRRPRAFFQIVGSCSDADRRRFERVPGVECTGFAEDIRPLLAEASCFVVPIRVGGGTRLKIVEGWAMGCPIVSTSVGCEGLQAVDEVNILIRDEPEEFADSVLRVLENDELQQNLGLAGRQTVTRSYSWSVIGQTIRRAYDALMASVE